MDRQAPLNPTTYPLRVAVAEPNGDLLRAILRILGGLASIQVVAAGATPQEWGAALDGLCPHLVVLDFRLAGLYSLRAGSKLLLLTIHDGGELRAVARTSTADAVLCKTRLDDELKPAIARLFPHAVPQLP